MSLFASLLGASAAPRFGDTASASNSGWLIRAIGGGKTAAGTVVTEHSALRLPVVYACVNRIANPLARFPIRIMRPKAGGGSEEVTDHPLSQRLGVRPNDFMSSRTLRKTVQAHALLWGNGYVEIERNGRGPGGGPLAAPALGDTASAARRFPRLRDHDRRPDLPPRPRERPAHHGPEPGRLCGPFADRARPRGPGLAQALEQFGGKFFANDAKSGGFLMHPGRLSPGPKPTSAGRAPATRTPLASTRAAPIRARPWSARAASITRTGSRCSKRA